MQKNRQVFRLAVYNHKPILIMKELITEKILFSNGMERNIGYIKNCEAY